MTSIDHIFPIDLPAAQGHFPGNPIIPGAFLLNETLHVIEDNLGISLLADHFVSAKFLRPVRPGDRVKIDFSHNASDGTLKFTCSVAETTVLTGFTTRKLATVAE